MPHCVTVCHTGKALVTLVCSRLEHFAKPHGEAHWGSDCGPHVAATWASWSARETKTNESIIHDFIEALKGSQLAGSSASV